MLNISPRGKCQRHSGLWTEDISAASGKQKMSFPSPGLGLSSQSLTQSWGLKFSVSKLAWAPQIQGYTKVWAYL